MVLDGLGSDAIEVDSVMSRPSDPMHVGKALRTLAGARALQKLSQPDHERLSP